MAWLGTRRWTHRFRTLSGCGLRWCWVNLVAEIVTLDLRWVEWWEILRGKVYGVGCWFVSDERHFRHLGRPSSVGAPWTVTASRITFDL
ncbi:hypothetical protein K443DRAFT_682394, partial [Laccaria amethystina LaAM-08-1]